MIYWKFLSKPQINNYGYLKLLTTTQSLPLFFFQLWNLFDAPFLFLCNLQPKFECSPGTWTVRYSKTSVCKNNYNTNSQALQVAMVFTNSNNVMIKWCKMYYMIQQLLTTSVMHPQTPLNPCTTFMLCLPMWGIELPVCSIEVLYCMLCTWHSSVKLLATYFL